MTKNESREEGETATTNIDKEFCAEMENLKPLTHDDDAIMKEMMAVNEDDENSQTSMLIGLTPTASPLMMFENSNSQNESPVQSSIKVKKGTGKQTIRNENEVPVRVESSESDEFSGTETGEKKSQSKRQSSKGESYLSDEGRSPVGDQHRESSHNFKRDISEAHVESEHRFRHQYSTSKHHHGSSYPPGYYRSQGIPPHDQPESYRSSYHQNIHYSHQDSSYGPYYQGHPSGNRPPSGPHHGKFHGPSHVPSHGPSYVPPPGLHGFENKDRYSESYGAPPGKFRSRPEHPDYEIARNTRPPHIIQSSSSCSDSVSSSGNTRRKHEVKRTIDGMSKQEHLADGGSNTPVMFTVTGVNDLPGSYSMRQNSSNSSTCSSSTNKVSLDTSLENSSPARARNKLPPTSSPGGRRYHRSTLSNNVKNGVGENHRRTHSNSSCSTLSIGDSSLNSYERSRRRRRNQGKKYSYF